MSRTASIEASEARAFVAEIMARRASDVRGGSSPRPGWIVVPAPKAPPEAFLRAADRLATSFPRFLWDAPGGVAWAGAGATHRLELAGSRWRTGSGEKRAALDPKAFAAQWHRDLQRFVHPALGGGAVVPRFFGGLAFDAERPGGEDWDAFPAGLYFLPRWTYGTAVGELARAWLALTVDELADDVDWDGIPRQIGVPPEAALRDTHREAMIRTAIDRELSTLLAELEKASSADAAGNRDAARGGTADNGRGGRHAPRPVKRVDLDRKEWREMVASARDGIAKGTLRKVVAARRTLVELDRPVEVTSILENLAAQHPDAFRYAVQPAPDIAFVGATPERLVARTGRRFAADPMAGSTARPAPASSERTSDRGADERVARAGDALLANVKERAEHAFVVDSVRDTLAPFTSELEVPDEPRVIALRHVLHLHTPVRGILREATHVLDLVSALHPTPSVGGVPPQAALRWIREREPEPRGWFAGPVGWFDGAGDGEFAIALRCALLRGTRAAVYAGAGIVAASEPDAEYEETRVKQRAILRALGVEER